MKVAARSPLVSVCIANYNGEEIIADCIQSILNQENAPDFEILVHDDASTDDSVTAIEQYDSVRLIQSSSNVGFCISNNRMAATARGQFVLLLNNDARLYPDALATLVEESHKRGDNAVLGLPQYNEANLELVDFGQRLDYFCSSVPLTEPSDENIAMVIGACMWVPLELWNTIGGFPEWFETNAEDVYLCCYARMLGHKVFVPGKSGFLHMIGHSLGGGKSEGKSLTISVRRRYFSERNRLFVQWMFYPLWLVPVTTAANLIALTVEAIVVSIANRKLSLIRDIYLRSQFDAFSMIKRVSRERRSALLLRRISFSEFFRTFTLVPQKLRLLWSTGLPRAPQ
ncbi:MAG: glycosyltransferase family 2 protein [Woeseiaceae bacterium]